MAIVGDEIYDYVVKQINQRQSAHGSGQGGNERTLEELTYLNSKTSWIKFASGVSVTEEKLSDLGFAPGSAEASRLVGNGLAQNYVLYNGISTLTDTNEKSLRLLPFSSDNYEASPDYGIIPTPGIVDLSIKALNRGSLKKATIKLKVQDRSQLSIIDTLYMRLGYTVLLEWGNSVFIDNDGQLDTVKETIVERRDLFFNENISWGTSYTEILKRIEYYREKYCGNYDGMLGKISNFSWTFNPDGSYDVDLTVISWGDVIESLKSNVTADKKTIDFVEDTPILSQENTIVNTKRKDNILFSLLHAMKFIAGNDSTGKGGNITIDNIPQGNFISSGSAKIQVEEKKVQFTAKYKLMEWYSSGNHQPVDSKAFGWKKIENTKENLDVFRPTLQKFPFYDIDNKNLQETLDWVTAPPSEDVKAPPSNKMGENNGAYTYQEVVTRTAGDPKASPGDSTFSAALGISSDMLYFKTFGDLTSSTTKPPGASWNNRFEAWYKFEKGTKENNYKSTLPFPPMLYNLINTEVSNFSAVKWRDVVQYLKIYWNHPRWAWGISIDGNNFYAGLTTKWGIDGGTNFTLSDSGLKTTKSPDSPELQKITSINDAKVIELRAQEFQKFKDENQVPIKLSKAPVYGPDGKPTDNNYEFFARFVAKDAKEATEANSGVDPLAMRPKPFFWEPVFEDKLITLSSQQFDNPLRDLEFDTKGAFQLNTDPISYYLRFGFLLQILRDKVVFKIDENNTDHKDNTSIFQINVDPGKSEMLCIRSATIGQISYDFRTCIVRRDKFTKPWMDPNDPNQGTQKVFPELKVWANEDNIEIEDENKKYTIADTLNVYLNFDFIGRCMESNSDEKSNISMYGFINSICSGINKSLGGINNLEPIIDETTNTLNIVDTSPKHISSDDSFTVDRNDPYQLQLYGYTPKLNLSADVESYYPTKTPHYESTFARKVDLKTAITPEYATMITVGAAAGGYVKGVEATSFAKWNAGIIDRFKQNLLPASLPPAAANATGSSVSALTQASIEDTLTAYQQIMTKSPNCFGIIP